MACACQRWPVETGKSEGLERALTRRNGQERTLTRLVAAGTARPPATLLSRVRLTRHTRHVYSRQRSCAHDACGAHNCNCRKWQNDHDFLTALRALVRLSRSFSASFVCDTIFRKSDKEILPSPSTSAVSISTATSSAVTSPKPRFENIERKTSRSTYPVSCGSYTCFARKTANLQSACDNRARAHGNAAAAHTAATAHAPKRQGSPGASSALRATGGARSAAEVPSP